MVTLEYISGQTHKTNLEQSCKLGDTIKKRASLANVLIAIKSAPFITLTQTVFWSDGSQGQHFSKRKLMFLFPAEVKRMEIQPFMSAAKGRACLLLGLIHFSGICEFAAG